MKHFLLLLFVAFTFVVQSQPTFELSKNVYRLPYATGTVILVSRDHFTHTSPNANVTGRYDLVGTGLGNGCSVYRLVAAAPGIIRRIVDNHNTKPPGCDPDCQNFNNYVWIEHANGEWTKYTHMKQYSATQDAGLILNDTVCAGTFLGYECDIGQADGRHLHFEVRRPNNPDKVDISVAGGFMSRNDALHYIPVINSVSKHYLQDGDTWIATGSNTCTSTNITVPSVTMPNNGYRVYMASSDIITNNNAVQFQNGSNGLFHAGNSITFTPGFLANAGSSFLARIGNCAPTPFPGGCN